MFLSESRTSSVGSFVSANSNISAFFEGKAQSGIVNGLKQGKWRWIAIKCRVRKGKHPLSEPRSRFNACRYCFLADSTVLSKVLKNGFVPFLRDTSSIQSKSSLALVAECWNALGRDGVARAVGLRSPNERDTRNVFNEVRIVYMIDRKTDHRMRVRGVSIAVWCQHQILVRAEEGVETSGVTHRPRGRSYC